MTEPTYTDAQIEAQCTRLKQLEQMGDSFRVTHSEFRSLHDMLRYLLSERQAAMQGQGGEWIDGYPNNSYASEWFIAHS